MDGMLIPASRIKSPRPPRPAESANQRGFTLIEMVVGLAIMALLVSALATGITQAYRAAYFQRTGAVSIDEARRIIPIITKDLQTAKSARLDGPDFIINFEDPEDERSNSAFNVTAGFTAPISDMFTLIIGVTPDLYARNLEKQILITAALTILF